MLGCAQSGLSAQEGIALGNRIVKASGSQRAARDARRAGGARASPRSRGWASAHSGGRRSKKGLALRRGSNTVRERPQDGTGRGWGWGRGLRSTEDQEGPPAPHGGLAKAAPHGIARTGASRAVKGEPGTVYGPERVRDLRKGNADDLVVGQRTVVRQAAHYGILRGMLWTVVLGALLFWLPLLGPAVAGYVGGRKAGGPLRAVVAVAIPAAILLIGLAFLSSEFGIVPSANAIPQDFSYGPLADLQAYSLPIIASIQASIEQWVASPPEAFFIMGVFALVGGALSELRRREEETVIERLGIPLSEVKHRARAGEYGPEVQEAFEPPRAGRGRHPAMVAPVAAHDGVEDLVEAIVDGVAHRMGSTRSAQSVPKAALDPGAGRRRRLFGRRDLREPTMDAMRPVGATAHPDGEVATSRPRGRSTGGRGQSVEALESWEEVEPLSGALAPSRRRRAKPLRMGPGGALVPKPARQARTTPRLRWVSRSKRAEPVVYTSTSDEGQLRAAIEALSSQGVPEGTAHPQRAKRAVRPREPEHVSRRLPITSSILGLDEQPGGEGPAPTVRAPVKDVPEVDRDGAEVGATAGDEANDGPPPKPSMGEAVVAPRSAVGELIAPPRATVAPPTVARVVTPAAMAPSAALKSRSRKARAHAVVGEAFEEDNASPGMVVWEADKRGEGTDYFASRRGGAAASATAPVPANGAAAPAETTDWEEERIAAIVREREEWDRL